MNVIDWKLIDEEVPEHNTIVALKYNVSTMTGWPHPDQLVFDTVTFIRPAIYVKGGGLGVMACDHFRVLNQDESASYAFAENTVVWGRLSDS